MLSGIAGYGFTLAQGFTLQHQLTNYRIMYLIIKVLFEKTDFLKDLYVAAFFPHSSKTHAFIFWMSIITPTFGILLYFWETNKIMQFIPSFFGFTELMKDK